MGKEKFKCSHTDVKKVSELLLIQNPKNNNKHSKEQIDRLAKIIDFQGQRSPIVISKRSGFLTRGHGRLFALDKLKWEYAAVDYQDYNTEAEEYADMTADNEIARWAEFNTDKFLEDIKTVDLGDFELLGLKELPDILGEEKKELTDPDEIPEVVEPKAKLGQIYKLGEHRLMCGDSTSIDAVEKLMNGEKADMVFTDPPYGIGIDGQKKSIAKNPKHNRKAHEFRNWDADRPSSLVFEYLIGLNIPLIIFGGNYFADLLPASRGWIFWGKGQDGDLTSSDGELAWTNLDKTLRSVTVNRGALRGSVHPTQKPIEVVEFCLNYAGELKSVLDLFGGSGSTLIACEKTNRKCFMMELDPHYVDVIITRWENFTGKKAELLNG